MTPQEQLTHILNAVAQEWDVPIKDIRSKSRKQKFVEPRQVYCKLAITLTTATLKGIGALIQDRDHTTVLYSIQHISDIIHTEDVFRDKYTKILDRLRAEIKTDKPIERKSIKPRFPGVALIYRPYPKLMMQV